MNCLKCPNYWKTDIDESLCDNCGTQVQRSESEVPKDMPILERELCSE